MSKKWRKIEYLCYILYYTAYNTYAKIYLGDMKYMARKCDFDIITNSSRTVDWVRVRERREEGKRERLCRAELVRWRIYSNLCTIDDDKSLIFGARSHTMRIFNAYLVVMYFACVLFFTVPSVRHSNAATFFFFNVILFFPFQVHRWDEPRDRVAT